MVLISVCPSSPGWNALKFRYAPTVIAALKQIPGVRWSGEDKCWYAPDNALPILPDVLGSEARLMQGPTLYTKGAAPPPFFVENLRPYQQVGVSTLLDKRDFILAFDMRLGKGGRPSDRILTPKGWTYYNEIRVGDSVIGSDGRPHQVTGVFPRGKQRFMRVTFSDGASVSVSEDHLWAVRSATMKLRHEGWKVCETSSLASEPLIDAAGNARWFIPVVKPVEFTPVITPSCRVHPYVLGVLLGDGHFGVSTSFCPGDEEVPREVERLLPPGVKMKKWHAKDRATVYSLVGFGPFARELGLVGTRSWNKHVPLPYLFASIEERRDLLRGLLDTDGYFGDSIEYTTASERLADDVTFLVQSLGGLVRRKLKVAPGYTYKNQKRVGRPSHRLFITLPSDFIPTRVGAGDYTPRVREPVRAIRRIEPDGEDDCICIAVSAPDSLYVTDHFVVTHNTRVAASAAASLLAYGHVKTIALVYPASVKEEWSRQFREQTGGLEVVQFEGLAAFEPADFQRLASLQHLCVGVHYELIRDQGSGLDGRAAEFLRLLEARGPFVLVADEVQYLKNRKAGRTKAVHEFSRSSQCWGRWGLTGTPMRNYPRDMWAMFEFVQPGSMGSYSKFTTRYADGHMGDYGWVDDGVTNAEELKARLAATMFRLTRADVAQWLPKAERSVILCNMPKAELQRYQKAERALGQTALKAMADGDSTQSLGALKALAAMTTASKTSTLLDRIYEHCEERHVKILVFANFHETLESVSDAYLAQVHGQPAPGVPRRKRKLKIVDMSAGAPPAGPSRFTAPGFVAGGWLTPERRRKVIEQWKAHPGPAVLFANTISSGVGIDLSEADTTIFVELSWVPAEFLQAEARTSDVHLGKRLTPPMFEYLLTRGTIDENMGLRLIEKVRGIEKIVGASTDTSALASTLTNSGLVENSRLSLTSEDPETINAVLADLRSRLFGDDTPDSAGEDTDNLVEDAADDSEEEIEEEVDE